MSGFDEGEVVVRDSLRYSYGSEVVHSIDEINTVAGKHMRAIVAGSPGFGRTIR
jgi:hypothetical protein